MQENKNNIVHKLYHKIIQDDYTISTISELCSIVGISKKTFYNQYTSKEEFLLDLLSHFNEETATELEKLIESENDLVIKIIQTFKTLIFKTYKKNKIQECYNKQNKLSEFLEEEFEMIFTNTITKLLEKMNDESVLNQGTNYFLFSEVLVKFTIDALKNNHKHNSENNKLLIKHLLINALKGICAISEYKKIDDYNLRNKY